MKEIKKVRKAVIPCGGYGTRFLPVTKVLPKEFLPIVDTPTLQYIIEETANSGIEEVLIILSPQKNAIRKFFESNRSLEQILLNGGKKEAYDIITRDFGVKVSFAVQEVMNGNGNAILLAEQFADGEPFAVLFGDDLMYTDGVQAVTKQLIDAYEKTGKTIVGVQQTPEKVARRCGVMKIKNTNGNLTEIDGIVEKPKFELPSTLVSLGRFVLAPEIFDALRNVTELRNGELYMSDALNDMAKAGKVVACEFEGKRYDIGNKEGYLEATVEFALRDKNLKDEFKEYLKNLNL